MRKMPTLVSAVSLPHPRVVFPRCHHHQLYLHEMVVEAERAFARLCPGAPLWPPPATDEDEEDDQAEMLKAVASTVQERSNLEDGEDRIPQDSKGRDEGVESNSDGNQGTVDGAGDEGGSDGEDEHQSG